MNIGFGKPARLEVTLVPIHFFLQLTSVPESAAVIIDGQFVGKTPFSSNRMLACPHVIEMECAGHAKWRTILTINERDSIDLGIVRLKNLAGKWRGKIGENSYAYNAGFNMTIQQTATHLIVKFYHKPREDCYYTGKIKGQIRNGEFHAEGNITYKYEKVFYWAQTKKKIAIQGKISDNWDRIEGKYKVDN